MSSRHILVFESIREILEQQGIAALTIVNIAEHCHLHPSTINYYFNGKSDLFMRFYTYMNNINRKNLPEFYFKVPESAAEAVKALANIIDLEIFRPYHLSEAQKRVYLYMVGSFDHKPEIKHFLVETHESYQKFLHQVMARYADAGIAEPRALDEGISAMMVVSMGHTFLEYYYGLPVKGLDLLSERERILKLVVRRDYRPLLNSLLGT